MRQRFSGGRGKGNGKGGEGNSAEVVPILLCGIADYESIGRTVPLLRLNRYEDPDSKDVITR